MRACDDSLRRLQTDHIDLYQLHRPSMTIPVDETLRALDDLVKAGKMRYIGCSTFPAWMVMEALATSDRYSLARFVSEQPPYNLPTGASKMNWCPWRKNMAWRSYPGRRLPWGLWPGAILRKKAFPEGFVGSPVRLERALRPHHGAGDRCGPAVKKMAVERGMTPSQLALLWVKDQPGMTAPIIGLRTLPTGRCAGHCG